MLERADPEELLYVPIVIGMNAADCKREWVEDICARLATHPNFNVRGNAVLGFGHIARTCRGLNLAVALPIISAALRDDHDFVRGHAVSAAEDLSVYLGVAVPGMDERSGENDT
ncbi:MAG: HEAT repeat domain-containing protein [Rhodoferax sp.]|nr:MAG: HEAT repeat domain-containing protein [Rhodoferax sp.]